MIPYAVHIVILKFGNSYYNLEILKKIILAAKLVEL